MSSKKHYLIHGASLICDKGNQVAPLNVTSQNFRTNEGKAYATEKDNIPDQNITPFGVCSVTQKKCVPITQSWSKTPRASIQGMKRLYEASECKCNTGGTIKVKNPGQNFVGEAENSDDRTIGDRKNDLSFQSKIKHVDYKLPLLVGYSKGFDYKHHFPGRLNQDVKKIALSQEDSTFGMNGKITIKDCDNLSHLSEKQLKENLIKLIETGTSLDNGLKATGKEMVEHFYKNLGGEYENDALNNVISGDSNFSAFRNAVAYKLLIKLKQVNWDLSKIKANDLIRFDNVAFNSDRNHDDGLTILIDAVEHIEVYIEEYESFPGNAIHIKLKFVLYDTFGLDIEDIQKFGIRNSTSAWRHITDWNNKTSRIHIQNSYGLGFTSWWVLQHRFNHKPFVTKATLFGQGYFDKNKTYRSPKDETKNTSNDVNYGQKD